MKCIVTVKDCKVVQYRKGYSNSSELEGQLVDGFLPTECLPGATPRKDVGSGTLSENSGGHARLITALGNASSHAKSHLYYSVAENERGYLIDPYSSDLPTLPEHCSTAELRYLLMVSSEQKVQVDLYYDVISPYAWIGFESLIRYENVWPIKVNLKPFSLRGIMQDSGNRPPGFVPAKSMYMLKDLERNNAYWNMKLKPPKVSNTISDTATCACIGGWSSRAL
ncbi:hypothetical protein ANCDUO_01916 [Ancylostoma duodenale]|uniref:DSBA-like thioredoxin domain-containing protein n=1 Tax=Ancylostoma duodenale TaxID=51022 RepID=A0A0C2H1V2_9BILA|nr:hypothetical protein ANCDUO_01916 [Ancylostoma duodenale]